MPWFHVEQDFDFRPKPGVTIAYKAGMTKLVTTACAKKAEDRGKGSWVPKPKAENADG